MTSAEMKRLAFAHRATEEAEYLLAKITRLLAQSEKLTGADPAWLQARRAELMEQAAHARVLLRDSGEMAQRFARILRTCPDPQTEQILRMRYERHARWENIALRIGGGNTADGVRKRAARYLATL